MASKLFIKSIPLSPQNPNIAHFLYVFDGTFDGMPGKMAIAGFLTTPKAGSIPYGGYTGYEYTTKQGTYMIYVHSDLIERGLTEQALNEAANVVAADLEEQSQVTTGKPKKRLRRRK